MDVTHRSSFGHSSPAGCPGASIQILHPTSLVEETNGLDELRNDVFASPVWLQWVVCVWNRRPPAMQTNHLANREQAKTLFEESVQRRIFIEME